MRRGCLSGFTLIELAVVLLIMGILIGGLLRGQELMTASRVRMLIQQQDGIRTAYFGFLDRYRFLPGDYPYATSVLTGVSIGCGVTGKPGNGNGNARIQIIDGESILAWEHLTKSGFLTGTYACTGNTDVNPGSVPRNVYGQYLQLLYDDNYAGITRDSHNLKTGSQIPSAILAEVDRKVDDGNALRGTFRGSTYTTGSPTDAACWDPGGVWNSVPGVANCGGATLF